MPTDRYTKFIFTLIAISLTVIALRPYFSPTSAGRGYERLRPQCAIHAMLLGGGPDGTVPIANSGHLPIKVLVGNPSANPVPVIVVNPPTPLFHR
jgi:hypothetical protein